MWSIIIGGIVLGVAIAVLVGPVFFLILNTAIRKGFLQALYVALGVALSDVLYILAIAFGFSQFDNQYFSSVWFSKLAGVLLILFGMVMIFKKVKLSETQELEFTKKDRLKFLIRGFLLNAINPSVVIFWIGAVSATSIQLKQNGWHIFLFFTSTILCVFACDVLKIYLSRKLSNIINEATLYKINVASGILMVGYGIWLFVNS